MQLLIDRERREFTPVTVFRAAHNLPPTFGVRRFEPASPAPSDWTREAEAELAETQQAVLDAMPVELPLRGWPLALPPLITLLQNKLYAAAPLLPVSAGEIAFTVSTFTEVLQRYLHALIRAYAAGQAAPSFAELYMNWLDSTVVIGSAVHSYIHRDEIWAVQVVGHAYGKAGLAVWTNAATYYVEDNVYNRRWQLFLEALLAGTAVRMAAAARAAAAPADAVR